MKNSFEAPQVMLSGSDTYVLEKTVTQTRSGEFEHPYRRFYPSASGDNFGIGDIVLFNPRWMQPYSRKPEIEGEVLAIHQYMQQKYPDSDYIHPDSTRTFGALVNFHGLNRFLPSKLLLPLTNDHVTFEDTDYFPKMIDVPFRNYSGASDRIKQIYQDPVSRAIWMAYRLKHNVDPEALEVLNRTSLSLADELKQHPIERSRVALWFRRNMKPCVDEKFAVCMVPYLLGEKIATYIPA